MMDEDIVTRFILLPYAMIGSDGVPTGTKPHPCLYGTFPRIIARYVRELKVLSLEEAVKKMTMLPAQRFGVTDPGSIDKGNWADLVLFDPEAFRDTAAYDEPCQFPKGLNMVMVNGQVVIDGAGHTGAKPGMFEYRKST